MPASSVSFASSSREEVQERPPLTDQYMKEFSRSAYLHCLYNYSYLAVVVALCLILGLHHHRRRLFGSKGLSKASSLAWKSRATALRLRFKKRAILGRWDLRGNVGMVSLFAAWTLYNAVAAFLYTNPPDRSSEGIGHMTYAFWRYAANRTGNLCYANLALLFLLVSRIDIISRLTGVGLQDLNWFHRWIGWGSFVLGMAHVLLYIVWFCQFRAQDGSLYQLRQAFGDRYFQMGIVATLAFLILVVLSVKWVRVNYHEVFMVSHIVCSIVFLISCYFHWTPKGYWPLIALFVFTSSRAHRTWTVTRNGMIRPWLSRRAGATASVPPKPSAFSVMMESRIEVLDEKCLRITVPVDMRVRWKAGDWVKLIFGDGYGFNQAHPFTITNAPQPLPVSQRRSRMSLFRRSSSSGSVPLLAGSPLHLPNEMVFIVAAYSSLTRRLYDAAAKDSSNALRVPVAVEGPYGHQPDLEGVDTLLLVGGGTGVAHVQAWWEGLVAGEEKARSSVRKLRVAWIVREEHHLDWVPLSTLLEQTPPSLLDPSTDLLLHRTGAASSHAPVKPSPVVEYIRNGRPDWKEVMASTVAQARGRVLVMVCGPSSLANAVVDAGLDAADPEKVLRGDLSGDVRVDVELFD